MVPVNHGNLVLQVLFLGHPVSGHSERTPSLHIPYNSPGMNITPAHLSNTSTSTHLQLLKISDAMPDAVGIFSSIKKIPKNSLVSQWLGLSAFTLVTQVQSLVWELRSCKPCGVGKKKKEKRKFLTSLDYISDVINSRILHPAHEPSNVL